MSSSMQLLLCPDPGDKISFQGMDEIGKRG